MSDNSTPQLMDQLYAELRKAETRKDALQGPSFRCFILRVPYPEADLLGAVPALHRIVITALVPVLG